MIRRVCVVAALFVSLSSVPAAAEPVAFSFSGVSLVDFAQATYRNLLGRDFVLSSDLVAMQKKITVSVKAIDTSAVPGFVENVLRSHGVKAVQRGGIYFLELDQGSSFAGLSPSVPALGQSLAPASVAPGELSAPGAAASPVPDESPPKVLVATVKNRPVSFVVEVVNASFGSQVARPGGGSRVVLSASADRIDAVRELVDQLDIAASVVEVSASFVEVTRSGSNARGLALVADALARRLAGVSIVPGEGRVSVRAGRYELVLDALATDGRFRQVSNSRVVGDDAERLSLSVGDETPTISSTSRDNAGNAVQNIVYRPSGVILDVLPKVMGSGRLSLLVDGQVSSFQSTTNGVAGSPTLVKRQVKTSVSVDDGQVLIIGGLDDSKTTAAEGGFSFLPDTWRNKSGSDSKTDLVLILSARVLPSGPGIAIN